MIVDDSSDACETMAMLLRAAGHDATWVTGGRQAIEKVFNLSPDLILLDLLMPEIDGPTFLEVVRSYLRIHALPVVVLSAVTEGPLLERTKKLGVSSILFKGRSSPKQILQAIEKAIPN